MNQQTLSGMIYKLRLYPIPTIRPLLQDPLFPALLMRIQKAFTRKLGGRAEVTMPDGTRYDILTDTHAIEVDFAENGQRPLARV